MTSPSNLFAGLPRRLPDELFTTLLDAASVRIERIVSHGHASPVGFWYNLVKLVRCEPTVHRLVRRVFLPPLYHRVESLREPTAAA